VIRVLIIDDHSAIRTGLEAALKHSPDVVPVGAGSDELELWPLFKRTAPDLVLLDYHLPGQDGLILCHRLKNTTLPPRVIIYSGYADALHIPLDEAATRVRRIIGRLRVQVPTSVR